MNIYTKLTILALCVSMTACAPSREVIDNRENPDVLQEKCGNLMDRLIDEGISAGFRCIPFNRSANDASVDLKLLADLFTSGQNRTSSHGTAGAQDIGKASSGTALVCEASAICIDAEVPGFEEQLGDCFSEFCETTVQ
ncbi:MAG: hypothetical protein KDD55_04945 [Bdellovibrionales bacterium]|nr:hypothetical protein [Bdellovibrionales bacterium]